jgi:hypothetical protein
VRRPIRRWLLAAASFAATFGAARCGDVNAALARQVEARHISADLLIQFTRAAEAGNRAVMAESEEQSGTFAREAEAAAEQVSADARRLTPILRDLNYEDELAILEEFRARFEDYRALDRQVLGLAVENTNVKAQRLSYGDAQQAADACRAGLDAAAASAPAASRWAANAHAARALAALREIQVLQAPHIAEREDAVMTTIEARMKSAEATARSAIAALGALPVQRADIAAATAALDRFLSVHAEILSLSRRNTNVRSLVLTLSEKRRLTPLCEERLAALRAALAKRGYPAGRTQ